MLFKCLMEWDIGNESASMWLSCRKSGHKVTLSGSSQSTNLFSSSFPHLGCLLLISEKGRGWTTTSHPAIRLAVAPEVPLGITTVTEVQRQPSLPPLLFFWHCSPPPCWISNSPLLLLVTVTLYLNQAWVSLVFTCIILSFFVYFPVQRIFCKTALKLDLACCSLSHSALFLYFSVLFSIVPFSSNLCSDWWTENWGPQKSPRLQFRCRYFSADRISQCKWTSKYPSQLKINNDLFTLHILQ